jgi:hypothetical protein
MKHLMNVAIVTVLSLAVIAMWPASTAASTLADAKHFQSLGPNGIRGVVFLRQQMGGGTSIRVFATGLEPGHTYVSLYYDNDECALEPYEEEDVIGDEYTANQAGVGQTSGTADDNLDEIHSVSVRDAATFDLLACAVVSPDNE